jgi:prepilin-type processing-associated H-X9-DG protein
MQCTNHLKQIGLAAHNYLSALRVFPPGIRINLPANCTNGDCRGSAFFAVILPYMEEANLAEQYKPSFTNSRGYLAWQDDSARSQIAVAAYRCPSAAGFDDSPFAPVRREYFGVAGGKTLIHRNSRGDVYHDGILYVNSNIRASEIFDGTSRTMMVGESSHGRVMWLDSANPNFIGCYGWYFGGGTSPSEPINDANTGHAVGHTKYPLGLRIDPTHDDHNDIPFVSDHAGESVNFVFADGHVAGLNATIAHDVYQSLSTRGGGEIITVME